MPIYEREVMEEKRDEGVIKFNYNLTKSGPLDTSDFSEIEQWRHQLFQLKLIGEYPSDKIGYGNISKRHEGSTFVISGTQTGKYSNLSGEHYTLVTSCDLNAMRVESQGPIAPSSESLTHYSFYQAVEEIHYIFHIHDHNLWNYMIENKELATSETTPYGTKEMAMEVSTLIQNKSQGLIVMKGHEDGIIAFGSTAEITGQLILDLCRRYKISKN